MAPIFFPVSTGQLDRVRRESRCRHSDSGETLVSILPTASIAHLINDPVHAYKTNDPCDHQQSVLKRQTVGREQIRVLRFPREETVHFRLDRDLQRQPVIRHRILEVLIHSVVFYENSVAQFLPFVRLQRAVGVVDEEGDVVTYRRRRDFPFERVDEVVDVGAFPGEVLGCIGKRVFVKYHTYVEVKLKWMQTRTGYIFWNIADLIPESLFYSLSILTIYVLFICMKFCVLFLF